jgi:hypothetical protein
METDCERSAPLGIVDSPDFHRRLLPTGQTAGPSASAEQNLPTGEERLHRKVRVLAV